MWIMMYRESKKNDIKIKQKSMIKEKLYENYTLTKIIFYNNFFELWLLYSARYHEIYIDKVLR